MSSGGGVAVGIHLGMLEELLKHFPALRFDFVAGCSGGGWAGAVYCIDPTRIGIEMAIKDYLALEAKDLFGRFYKITSTAKNIAWRISGNSVRSFLSGKKYMKFLESYFGNVKMNELDVPLALVGHDINFHTELIFGDAGERFKKSSFPLFSLAEAVYVTSAQPLYIPPLLANNGNNWVDGGITTSLPVDIVRAADVDDMWVFAANSSNRPAGKIRGLDDIIIETVDSMVGFNLRLALESLQVPDGIKTHILYGDDFPDTEEFLDFFDKSEELVEYGRKTMRDYLANPQPVNLRRL